MPAECFNILNSLPSVLAHTYLEGMCMPYRWCSLLEQGIVPVPVAFTRFDRTYTDDKTLFYSCDLFLLVSPPATYACVCKT